jgi:hypothetical protein
MPTSQNGYPANNPALVSSRFVPGTTRKLTVRNGPAGDLLLWVAAQFDKLVEDIEQGILDDWGYAERPIRGSTTTLSNHASGTAIDLNATAHPMGTDPHRNFSQQEIDQIHAVLAKTDGCVGWGGDYTGRLDGMHFEINNGVSESRCAAVLAKLAQEEDVFGMMNKDDIEDAFYKALYRIHFGVRFSDNRNFGDEEAQQTGSLIGIQGQNDKLIEQNDKIIAQNQELINAIKALKA